jgi:lactoylglutathione lyase
MYNVRLHAGLPRLTTHRGRRAVAMSTDTRAALHSLPGVAKEQHDETKGFKFQQTMIRIKEPERSLDFYTRVLGMTLLTKLDFPSMKFTLYFLAYCSAPDDVPDDPEDRVEACMGRFASLSCVIATIMNLKFVWAISG